MLLYYFSISVVSICFEQILFFNPSSAQTLVSTADGIDHNLPILTNLTEPVVLNEEQSLAINQTIRQSNLRQLGDHILYAALELKPLMSELNLADNSTFIFELISKVESISDSFNVLNYELLPPDLQSIFEHLQESLENIKTSLFLMANREEIDVLEKLSPLSNSRKRLDLLMKCITILKQGTISFINDKTLKNNKFELFVHKFELDYILALQKKIGIHNIPNDIKQETMSLQQIIHNFLLKNETNVGKSKIGNDLNHSSRNNMNVSTLANNEDFQLIYNLLKDIENVLKDINFSAFTSEDINKFHGSQEKFTNILIGLHKLKTDQPPHKISVEVNKLYRLFHVFNDLESNGNMDIQIYNETILNLIVKLKEVEHLNSTVKINYYSLLLDELSDIMIELEELKEYKLSIVTLDKVAELIAMLKQLKTQILGDQENVNLPFTLGKRFEQDLQMNSQTNFTSEQFTKLAIQLENLKTRAKEELDDVVLNQIRIDANEIDQSLKQLSNKPGPAALSENIDFLQLEIKNFESEISLKHLLSLIRKHNEINDQSQKVAVINKIERHVLKMINSFGHILETLKMEFTAAEKTDKTSKRIDVHTKLYELLERIDIVANSTEEYIAYNVFDEILKLKNSVTVILQEEENKNDNIELNKDNYNIHIPVSNNCDVSWLENELVNILISSGCKHHLSDNYSKILLLGKHMSGLKQNCSEGVDQIRLEQLATLLKKIATGLSEALSVTKRVTLKDSKVNIDQFHVFSMIWFHGQNQ